MRYLRWSFLFILPVLMGGRLAGDEILFKNGNVVRGKILLENSKKVVIKIFYGEPDVSGKRRFIKMNCAKSQVQWVVRDATLFSSVLREQTEKRVKLVEEEGATAAVDDTANAATAGGAEKTLPPETGAKAGATRIKKNVQTEVDKKLRRWAKQRDTLSVKRQLTKTLNKIKEMNGLEELNGDGDIRQEKIHAFYLTNNPGLVSIAPLYGLVLAELDISGNVDLKDISPLKGMPVAVLDLSGCESIEKFTALRGMLLRELSLSGCAKLTSLEILQGMPLQKIKVLGPTGLDEEDYKVLEQIPTLKKVETGDEKRDQKIMEAVQKLFR